MSQDFKSTKKITIYQPQPNLSFIKLFNEIIKDLKPANELGFQLAKRDVKAAYRQSVLGVVWAFIPPIVTSLIWIFLNSSNTIKIQETPIPYPVFVLTGTLLWQILAESVGQPLKSVKSGKSILAKLNFPRESLLVHGLYSLLFNSSLRVLIIIAVLIVFQINPGWQVLGFIPLFFGLMVTGFSIGLISLPIGMMYGDIARFIPFMMQFFMYISPVIYPIPDEGVFAIFNKINPFRFLIETSRNILTGQTVDYLLQTGIVLIISFIILIIGVIIFRFIMPVIIERVGS
ncbi:ABC transporter permease [Robertkochia solimangrovi]|uniref:ABC transporter permease n=1 Tax=Robertkochia solimangrovi TaxID=2213046 RepID=UPI00117D3FA9|nr:ABC transporter permease [Robertkochia solimangrovi]TRZ44971.1 ABC transporter permease [Robertkochia solimangrovi]